MKKIAVIIPARMDSSRLPGKALLELMGKPLIQHVVLRIRSPLVSQILVATDSQEIKDALAKSNCSVFMSKKKHICGTDRIAEAAQSVDADYIINVQGDELLAGPSVIDGIIDRIDDELGIGTLFTDILNVEEVDSPNVVKVVVNSRSEVLYLSRFGIPFDRKQYNGNIKRYKQVGIYVFKKEMLLDFSKMAPGQLEQMEGVELLRALEYGIRLKGIYLNSPTRDVNVPEDVKPAVEFIKRFPIRG